MSANETQIGGDHYKGQYQHWDFVCDTNIHYLLGCATKYISRWRKKNGLEDLKKSLHYLTKAEERDIWPPGLETIDLEVTRFVMQHEHRYDQDMIGFICCGEYENARKLIEYFIEEQECGPTSGYVNQD